MTRGRNPACRQIGTFLPISHLHILSEEAKLFGVRRGQFLELLLRRKLGLVDLRWPANAPAYEFTDDSLSRKLKFVWYLSEDLKALFDGDCLQMGNLTAQAWIVLELNRWIGRPFGLRSSATGDYYDVPTLPKWSEP